MPDPTLEEIARKISESETLTPDEQILIDRFKDFIKDSERGAITVDDSEKTQPSPEHPPKKDVWLTGAVVLASILTFFLMGVVLICLISKINGKEGLEYAIVVGLSALAPILGSLVAFIFKRINR